MFLKSVQPNNFRSFKGDHEAISMEKVGLQLIQGENVDDASSDSNGSGKSTLLQCVEWVLFGETSPVPSGNSQKGLSGDDVITDGEKEGGGVVIVSDEIEYEYRIIRHKKRKAKTEVLLAKRKQGTKKWIGEKELTTLDTSETQKRINDILGLDLSIWTSAIVRGQENRWCFADATDKGRKDVLTEIMRLEYLDEWLKKVRAASNEAGKDEAVAINTVNTLSETLRVFEADAERDRVQIEQWEAGKASRERDSAAEANGNRKELESLRAESVDAEQIQQQINRLDAQINDPSNAVLIDEGALNDMRKAKRDFEDVTAKATARRDDLAEKLNRIVSLGEGECEVCASQLTATHLETQKQALQTRIRNAEQYFANRANQFAVIVETERNEELRIRNAREENNKRAMGLTAEKQRLLADFRNAERLNEQVKHAAERVANADNRLQSIKDEKNPYTVRVAETTGRIESHKEKLVQAEAEALQSREDQKYLKFWAANIPVFKNWLFDSVVNVFAEATNRWLKVLSGGSMWIEYDTQSATKDGKKTTEKFKIVVYRYGADGTVQSRDYRNFSGGEKRRISIAIDAGLATLIQQRATKSWNIVCYDEPDLFLDRVGRNNLMQMFKEIAEEKDSVIVVAHDSDMKSQFPSVLTIRKENGSSHVVQEAA